MKIIYSLAFLLLFTGSFLYGQEEETEEYEEYEEETEEYFEEGDFLPRFSLGIEFSVGIPLNKFKENLNTIGVGASGSFLIRTNPSSNIPVFAGLSGGVVTYDSESQNQIIIIDGATIDARLITRNSVFFGHGIFRVLPPVNISVQPYFDGMIGFKNLYTRTTLEDREFAAEDGSIESYIEQGDWAFSYGGAVGAQILVGGNESLFIMLDARVSYLVGNAADYLVRIEDPNVQIVDTIDAFEEKNSTTDMMIPQLGVTFIF